MDLRLNINGLDKDKFWNEAGKQHKKHSNNKANKNLPEIEDDIDAGKQKLKEKLIDLQDYASTTQDKINILELASETLNIISGNLNEVRQITLEKLNSLDGYELPEKIKDKLENLEKLENIQQGFENVRDDKDSEYSQIVEEFKNTSKIAIKLAKTEEFKEALNNNPGIERFIDELNSTISCLSSTRSHLNKVKETLISNIKNLSIALENMVSSYSKIRNLELATETVKLTQHQILKEAQKSIQLQVLNDELTVNRLMS